MKVSKLSLRQFRNLSPLTLVPHPHFNLIVGPNASGKTNLCEALYFASRGQLLKGERQRELIRWECTWSSLSLEVAGEHIKIQLNGVEEGKTILLSGESASQRRVFDAFKVLIFTPDDLQVLKGNPSLRRRLLDRSISDLDKHYRAQALAYEHVVRRKNALLRHEASDEELLQVYNQKLLEHGAHLVEARLRFLEEMNAVLEHVHPRLNQAGSRLQLRYESEVEHSLTGASEGLQAALQRIQAREKRAGMSLIGPHRDDVAFYIEDVDLRRFGSQGQQKTALIAFKLAQLELYRRRFDEYPVLVLDDVLSELDPQRTQLLLDHLPQELQLFLTETHLSPPLLGRADKVFHVEQGRVSEVSKEGA